MTTDNQPTNCPHCGKPLTQPNAKYCTQCGSPLRSIETVHGGSLAKFIIHLPCQGTQEEFLSKAVITLGRKSSNMLQVMSPIVSGEHARINLTRQGHTITDLGSTNGTYVNGQRLKAQQPHLLVSNDIIRFSDALGNSAKLTYIAPSGFGEVGQAKVSSTFQLSENVSFIGRNNISAIFLDHPAVSWNHAKVIRQSGDSFIIQDLSSNNGTFVNGKQLRQARLLARGDVVQIGPFNLVYQGRGKFTSFSAERNFRLEAVNLEKALPASWFSLHRVLNPMKAKVILQNLNLVINPREFVALVGGSGAGKSTLLKALSGVNPATRGVVLVNGDNLYENFNLYRTMLGYVPQDDIIHDGLEVRQVLYYAACLRLPDATAAEMAAQIESVLAKVNMTAEAKTMVRDLSGGQRKRVSMAVELLAEPWIFFLDEPTSGLDPGLEKLMMDTLRQLADEGRTIVLVTHATNNIINNCDHVAFLAPGGLLTYFGPPEQATEFFKVRDFSDIYTRLSLSYTPQDAATMPAEIETEYQRLQPTTTVAAGTLWAEHYRHSLIYETFITNRQTGEVARPMTPLNTDKIGGAKAQFQQFTVLARRYLDLIRHDHISLVVLLGIMPLIGLFLLMISSSATLIGHPPSQIEQILVAEGHYAIATSAETLLFMMALSATMLGVFAASFEFIKEKAIYQRERMVNLRVPAYFASKFVVLGGFGLIQCLLLLLMLALKISFPATGAMTFAPIEYYITLIFTVFASIALGLFISALARSRNVVIYIVLVVMVTQIIFSGAIFELTSMTQPLSYLTITRWSLEALGETTDLEQLNQLGQVRFEREVDFGRGSQKVVENVAAPIKFHLNYNPSFMTLLWHWLGLIVHIVWWSGLAMGLLRREDQV